MKNFVLIGVGGYIAPQHLKAIKKTGNTLLAALDKHDSVGVLDMYFPEAHFFTEFERFDRHCEKLRRTGFAIDYVVVCSPNYLHDAHIRFGLRIGADVICEKPVVLNPWNVDALLELEAETNRKVFTILQLRLHPFFTKLKQEGREKVAGKANIELKCITTRGKWYYSSWKGSIEKSGGITTNIGVHYFDLLIWLYGNVIESRIDILTENKACGFLELERAKVNWFLSIDPDDLPEPVNAQHKTAFRSLVIDNEAFEFSDHFNELHTLSYQKILAGEGFGLQDNLAAIQLIHDIRKSGTGK